MINRTGRFDNFSVVKTTHGPLSWLCFLQGTLIPVMGVIKSKLSDNLYNIIYFLHIKFVKVAKFPYRARECWSGNWSTEIQHWEQSEWGGCHYLASFGRILHLIWSLLQHFLFFVLTSAAVNHALQAKQEERHITFGWCAMKMNYLLRIKLKHSYPVSEVYVG